MTLRYILGPIALVLVSISLVCCTERTLPVLAEADAVMESCPDSALAILEGVDTAALDREADKALYALLMTQAMVKTNRPIESDSLICVAHDYFSEHGREFDRMRAYFYHGYILVMGNNNSYAQAIECAIPAYDISLSLDDDYWRAKCAELLADIYSHSYHYEEALEYRREAADYYNRVGKIANHRYSLADMASELGALDQKTRAITLLDSVRVLAATSPVDSNLIAYSESPLLDLCIDNGDVEKAIHIAHDLYNHRLRYGLSSSDYSRLAYVFYVEGRMSESDSCLNNAHEKFQKSPGTMTVFYASLASMLSKEKKYKEEKEYTDSILKYQNEAICEMFGQSILAAQQKINDQKLMDERRHSDNLLRNLVFCLIFFPCVIVLIIRNNRIKKRNIELELESRISQIEALSDDLRVSILEKDELVSSVNNQVVEITSLKSQVTELCSKVTAIPESVDCVHESIEYLFRDRFKTINLICNEYHTMHDNEQNRLKLIHKVIDEVNSLKEKRRLDEIKDLLNTYMDGIIDKLTEECKFLKQADIDFLTYIYAGFSSHAVCLFTDIRIKNFYNKRTRLRNRIEAANPPSKILFISKIK